MSNSNIHHIKSTLEISLSPYINYHLPWRRVWFYSYFAQLDRPHASASSQGNFHLLSLVATASLKNAIETAFNYCVKHPRIAILCEHHCFKGDVFPHVLREMFFPYPKVIVENPTPLAANRPRRKKTSTL